MKDVADHYRDVVALGEPLPESTVPIDEALGRVLVEDIRARFAVPPFTNSAMDGFAVRADEVREGHALRVSDDIPAGRTDIPVLPACCAIRIMTGAPMPEGADAVIPVENTQDAGANMAPDPPARIVPTATVPAGANVRRRGEDINEGDLLYPSGTHLTAAHLSALVSVGYGQVAVRSQVRVGVITTGEELREAGADLALGQIPDSNSILLAGMVREAGAVPLVRAFHADTVEDFMRDLQDILDQVDLLITAGGVSAGAFEVVKAALRAYGVEFVKVGMQPGKPQGCGVLEPAGHSARRIPILCLPGNPVSVFVSWHLFAVPLMRALAGEPPVDFDALFTTVRAGTGWSRKPGRVQFLPVTARERKVTIGECNRDERGTVAPDGVLIYPSSHGGSKSHFVASLAGAAALARVPAERAKVEAGDLVDVMWLGRAR